MANPNPNITKMVNYAKKRTEECRVKVDDAISQMLKQNIDINFNSVSRQADVSKGFLYSHKDIKDKITMLRSNTQRKRYFPRKAPLNDSSKNVIIDRQKLKIKDLNKEISKLRHELQILYGKLASYQSK